MNVELGIPSLLTLQDIMKSDKELEYIKEMRNFTLITEKNCMKKQFLHTFVLKKQDLKLLRFCISRAISEHVDMIEEDSVEDLEISEEIIEEILNAFSIGKDSLYLDNGEIIMKRNSPNEHNERIDDTSLAVNATEILVDTATVIGNEHQKKITQSTANQRYSDTLSGNDNTEISEYHEQNSSMEENNEIYWNRIGYNIISNELKSNRTAEPATTLNTVDSIHKFQRKNQLLPGIGQLLLIHFFDSLWYPFAWYEWQINEKLPDNYVDVSVETGSIDLTFELIWRRLYSNDYAYFSCDFKNCNVLKLKKNQSRNNRVYILQEVMKRERGGYLDELKVLDAIAWPYYYTLPPQDEGEHAMFEFDINWYWDRDPLDYAIVAFATFFEN